jgi:hypothetical protein
VRERCRAVAARFAGNDSLAVAARCVEELANRGPGPHRSAARPRLLFTRSPLVAEGRGGG